MADEEVSGFYHALLLANKVSFIFSGGRDAGGGGRGQGGGGQRGTVHVFPLKERALPCIHTFSFLSGDGGGRRIHHMDEIGAVQNLLNRSGGMSEAEIQRVVNPSLSDRNNRSALMTKKELPPVDEWRYENSIGAVLDMSHHTIRSNHFKVELSGLPEVIYCYHVYIYKYSRDGVLSTEDCVAKEESKTLTILLESIRLKHKGWKKMGYVYDGKSALFTSSRLPFVKQPDGSYFHTEDVALLNLDGTPGKKYQALTY